MTDGLPVDGPVAEGEPPSLPVYIIHWDQPEWCASAARSVLQSVGVRTHLHVIDNGQRAGPALQSVLPRGVAVTTLPRNRGYAGAANAALQLWLAGDGDNAAFCVIGSHDLHVDPESLAHLLTVARATPAVGILGPASLRPVESSGGYWTGRFAGQHPVEGPDRLLERDWVSGTCMLIRRACAAAVGPFDERFGSYVEDVDYCLRARDAGWTVAVVTTARAWGLGTACSAAESMIEANTVRLVFKRHGVAAGLGSLVAIGRWTLRCLAGSAAFWRAAARRVESRRFLRRHLRALVLLARTPPRRGRHPESWAGSA